MKITPYNYSKKFRLQVRNGNDFRERYTDNYRLDPEYAGRAEKLRCFEEQFVSRDINVSVVNKLIGRSITSFNIEAVVENKDDIRSLINILSSLYYNMNDETTHFDFKDLAKSGRRLMKPLDDN